MISIGSCHSTNRTSIEKNQLQFNLVRSKYNEISNLIMQGEEENDDGVRPRSLLVQRRSKKNRQTKTQLVFDEQARK